MPTGTAVSSATMGDTQPLSPIEPHWVALQHQPSIGFTPPSHQHASFVLEREKELLSELQNARRHLEALVPPDTPHPRVSDPRHSRQQMGRYVPRRDHGAACLPEGDSEQAKAHQTTSVWSHGTSARRPGVPSGLPSQKVEDAVPSTRSNKWCWKGGQM